MASVARVILTGLGLILAIPLFPFAIRIVREYERGVIFRLGRLVGARGPGLFFIIPIVDNILIVDLRTVTLDVATQECITRDNVTVRVNAVIYFRVMNPEWAIVNVVNYMQATHLISQTTLRSVLGQSELDELLAQREQLNQRLQTIIDEATEPWGVKVALVEIKDVELPAEMVRVISKQAEAERERRAKIIHADGEAQAAERLAEAGRVMTSNPGTLQLRYLQTLTEIATERNSTLIFPLPIDLIQMLLQRPAAGRPAGDSQQG